MEHKQIVVAGAGGYLASNVIPTLVGKAGSHIYALSSKSTITYQNNPEDNISVMQISMEDYSRAGELIGGECDIAVNFSWIGTRGEDKNEDKVQGENEKNSIKLLNSLIEAGCSRFIQIGSLAEYGMVDGSIDETTECRPITAYAKRKFSCAEKMRKICEFKGVQFVEFRMGSMYGNYMGDNNLLGFLCQRLSEKKHVKLITKCMQDWEYTHVDDFTEILVKATFSDALSGIFNISSGETQNLRFFIETLENKFGLDGYVEFGDIEQGIGCQSIRCDNKKIKEVFGKESFIAFDEGIDSVIKYYIEGGRKQ